MIGILVKVLMICILKCLKIQGQDEYTLLYQIPELNQIFTLQVNLKCNNISYLYIKAPQNNQTQNLVLRIDYLPNKCISTRQDYHQPKNNWWKIKLQKTCCNILNNQTYQTHQIVLIARKGIYLSGFPIPIQILQTYIPLILLLALFICIFILYQTKTQKQKEQ